MTDDATRRDQLDPGEPELDEDGDDDSRLVVVLNPALDRVTGRRVAGIAAILGGAVVVGAVIYIFITLYGAHAAMYSVWNAMQELVKNEEQAQWSLERVKVGHPTESHHVMARVPYFQELERQYCKAEPAQVNGIVEAIRGSLAEQHELELYALRLVKPGGVPKTSSGKIQRAALAAMVAESRLADRLLHHTGAAGQEPEGAAEHP